MNLYSYEIAYLLDVNFAAVVSLFCDIGLLVPMSEIGNKSGLKMSKLNTNSELRREDTPMLFISFK
jgi:hypothetical protein